MFLGQIGKVDQSALVAARLEQYKLDALRSFLRQSLSADSMVGYDDMILPHIFTPGDRLELTFGQLEFHQEYLETRLSLPDMVEYQKGVLKLIAETAVDAEVERAVQSAQQKAQSSNELYAVRKQLDSAREWRMLWVVLAILFAILFMWRLLWVAPLNSKPVTPPVVSATHTAKPAEVRQPVYYPAMSSQTIQSHDWTIDPGYSMVVWTASTQSCSATVDRWGYDASTRQHGHLNPDSRKGLSRFQVVGGEDVSVHLMCKGPVWVLTVPNDQVAQTLGDIESSAMQSGVRLEALPHQEVVKI